MKPNSPIAVVGIAGLFPGAATLEHFWNNLVNKIDSIDLVPEHRWIAPGEFMYSKTPAPDKAYSLRMGLLDSLTFDGEGTNLDPDLLKALDPLYHIALYAGRAALKGCNLSGIRRHRIGVALASIALPTDGATRITREITGRSFEKRLTDVEENNPLPLYRHELRNAEVTALPGAILARAFSLGGGSFTLDAACASSLYAVKIACDELLTGNADAMLTGGVSRPDALFTQVGFSQLRALSPSGQCAPFDESADGLVVGEGAGIFVLKRLDDAVRDKDPVYGIIRGIGLSNDISGNLLAPDVEGQVRAMEQAYRMADWSPRDVDHIECHGAGTPVGDNVELHSLCRLWGHDGWDRHQCPIGSVKSAVGHLLTAAGAAGIMKTLLGFQHKTLPPSFHFNRAPKNSPLDKSPFRVQVDAEPWDRRRAGTPRRAAVSAFGFGGVNGHLLLEEWDPALAGFKGSPNLSRSVHIPFDVPEEKSRKLPVSDVQPAEPVAIVGMDACFGTLSSLREFQHAVFSGASAVGKRPLHRWKGCENILEKAYGLEALSGAFIENVDFTAGEFHIPPNEIPDILPQQLLMLKVAAQAIKDAGLPLRERRPRAGAVIGIGFDFETTDYHLRWDLFNRVREWNKIRGLNLTDKELEVRRNELMDKYGPPLTAARTIGALGSIVASRIAREFQFGGPSFSVSGEAASGLKALEIAVRSLQQRETDVFLAGAVDMAGDGRAIASANALRPFSSSNSIRPLDSSADGPLPGEGACALVLMRIGDALAGKHRIYGVIRGIGKAGGPEAVSENTYFSSLASTFSDNGISPESIGLIETHGSGHPSEDDVETLALKRFFGPFSNAPRMSALGSLKPIIGHTGAAAGLASVVKTALCLFHEMIPPLKGYQKSRIPLELARFHVPVSPQFWLKDNTEGPRRALAAAMTTDGNCMHVVMEEADMPHNGRVVSERQKPAGESPWGLFVVEGMDKTSLAGRLEKLSDFISGHGAATGMETVARAWHKANPPDSSKFLAASVVAKDVPQLLHWVKQAKNAVLSEKAMTLTGPGGCGYSPRPVGRKGKTAFVFPGSGNHYLGMGREIGVLWPEVFREMEKETRSLRTQMRPECHIPWRTDWREGWETDAYQNMVSDPLNMIFGQVVHGSVMTRLVSRFGVTPRAVIGYSLGESAGYFALGAWPDREEMLKRMMATDLFTTRLAGPCLAAREAWNIPPDEDVDWGVAVVNRPADHIREILPRYDTARLLIVNTPHQCVIGGGRPELRALIRTLNCEFVFLDGVVTVHCDAAKPVAEAYRNLHLFPVAPPEGVTFYSCARGRALELTTESAADSILEQALEGFDFNRTIDAAYADGIRVFVEMGPHASCTGMIRTILEDRPHMAVSACFRGENPYLTILKCLGSLSTERVPVDLEALYGDDAFPQEIREAPRGNPSLKIRIPVGGAPPALLPPKGGHTPLPRVDKTIPLPLNKTAPTDSPSPEFRHPFSELIRTVPAVAEATSRAHRQFLDLSADLGRTYAKAFDLQNRILGNLFSRSDTSFNSLILQQNSIEPAPVTRPVAFSREMCMEFAVGSVEKVLGPEFAVIDTYPKRVRLPDEPLMLVDRIISLEGEKCSLGPGRIVTEHDVVPGIWYLDGGKAPVCISVEAGQADLFLCSFLGIDHEVKGERAYRLLDAAVEFHRGLPEPGDTLRYEIEIEKFLKQGKTYLFFFHFTGTINGEPLITMTNGCAGFFTDDEVRNSGGIVLSPEETGSGSGKKSRDFTAPVVFPKKHLSDDQVEALRRGDLETCFGPDFSGITLPRNLRLPGAPMRLIDRIPDLDPTGGRYGLGLIRAEADIHPEDWFLTCHFKDDRVMPGTLMYECCAHTLRVFIQQMGWISDRPGTCYEPMVGRKAVLKCRGPVTPRTRHVQYVVEIREMGYNPEPYVIADAHMVADGRYIVRFGGISLKLSNVNRNELFQFWEHHRKQPEGEGPASAVPGIFSKDDLLEFALGKPSRTFGAPYKVFDEDRFIARLPNPPYLFIDRITGCEPRPWELKPDGWIEARFDVLPEHWYFIANRNDTLPFAVLLEIALQPCGFLAAYMGSALKSPEDLKFRNLGGTAVLHKEVMRGKKVLITRARLKQVSIAGGIIIQQFEFMVSDETAPVYSGHTTFGFFSPSSLANQAGIRDADKNAYAPPPGEMKRDMTRKLDSLPPRLPGDPVSDKGSSRGGGVSMPAKALLMIDEIRTWLPEGGPRGLGFVRGVKRVDPDEWFFKAHFFQDPVCPGSLGIESMIQVLKYAAIEKYGTLCHPWRFETPAGLEHRWVYRGQVIPENRRVEVEAVITRVDEEDSPLIMADGWLKVDGLYIYEMKNFGVKLSRDES